MAAQSYEVPIAAFLAALLETLADLDPIALQRFDKHMKEMTPHRLAKVVRLLKEERYKGERSPMG